ncbi:hypothetical protein GA0070616_3675 [Micromonospora nigra]|uniref:Hemerythrin HHE cation binding domain-containing protein n=1 Tax=Micromonospora nigra TaxID=145857 RepID=A0A1C6SFU7_9ACTN|nr:hypothetical protein [Micromonospora nigra]SCL28344.1 hypothetical protein GA0070616_3675 [Micromonospora nigra]
MATDPIRQPSTAPGLVGAGHTLRLLLLDPAEPVRRDHLRRGLIPLSRSFVEHVQATEGPDGRYAELVHAAPRLDRGVRLLVREHAVIAASLDALHETVRRPGVGADELRHAVAQLLGALHRHRQRGADLIWQAYQTDLGGET